MPNTVYLGKKEAKMLWHINKKCHFNGFSKAKKILHISSSFKHFFAYIIVLNHTIGTKETDMLKALCIKIISFQFALEILMFRRGVWVRQTKKGKM